MRRFATIVLLTAICLFTFVSCNMDAEEGIYSRVSSSTVSKNVNIKSYLGSFNSEHYYLSDEGVFRNGSASAIVSNTSSAIIRGASLTDSGELYVMSQKSNLSSSLAYYADVNSTPAEVPGSFKALLRNGLAYNDTNVYTLSGVTASPALTVDIVNYALETGDYAFFSVQEAGSTKYYVVKNDGSIIINGVAGDSSPFIVFQPIGDSGDFVLAKYNSSNATFEAHMLTSGGLDSSILFTMRSSLHYAYSTQAASFYYQDGPNEYIVIKASNFFDRYNITDETIESLSTGFAATLRTADIVNIEATASPMVFVAGTYESMLFEINMSTNQSTPI